MVLRLVGCLRRNGLARCWDGGVLLDVWGKYSKSPCSFVCRERSDARIDIVNFWGDKKWCLWKACWMFLIYVPLGFLVKNPYIRWFPRWVSMLLLLVLKPQWDVHTGWLVYLKGIAKQGRPETRLFWSPSQAEESVFGRSPVLLAGNEGPGWIGYVILIGWNSVLN